MTYLNKTVIYNFEEIFQSFPNVIQIYARLLSKEHDVYHCTLETVLVKIVGIIYLSLSRFTSKVETLVMMYKTHCQCILDTLINSNFDEVSSLRYCE